MTRLILISVLLSSCATKDISQPEVFEFSNGERWECHDYSQEICGMALKGCGPLKAHFDCVNNVRYIGKLKE